MEASQASDVGSIPITRWVAMELLNTIKSHVNIDTILTDPVLLVAAILLIGGPLLFIFSLLKYIQAKPLVLPPDFPREEPLPPPLIPPAPPPTRLAPHISNAIQEPAAAPMETPSIPVTPPEAQERTVVMPRGVAEIQGQMEIAFSQIKSLNKKFNELESLLESLARQNASRLEPNELKEPPLNPADFTQKLLKLAEHVIMLEKEMSRLKIESKPPVMPL